MLGLRGGSRALGSGFGCCVGVEVDYGESRQSSSVVAFVFVGDGSFMIVSSFPPGF